MWERLNQDIAVNVSGGNYKKYTVTIGSATAASTFLSILMLWTFLLAVERLKKEPKYCLGPDGLHSGSELQTQLMAPLLPPLLPPTPPSELMPSSRDNEVPPASIVINVTTNIKPSGQSENGLCGETGPDSRYSTQQMEQHLQAADNMGHSSRSEHRPAGLRRNPGHVPAAGLRRPSGQCLAEVRSFPWSPPSNPGPPP
ncbi:unnamed protein product [Arctogadus glacialis]